MITDIKALVTSWCAQGSITQQQAQNLYNNGAEVLMYLTKNKVLDPHKVFYTDDDLEFVLCWHTATTWVACSLRVDLGSNDIAVIWTTDDFNSVEQRNTAIPNADFLKLLQEQFPNPHLW